MILPDLPSRVSLRTSAFGSFLRLQQEPSREQLACLVLDEYPTIGEC
jgi:hypothetical protein